MLEVQRKDIRFNVSNEGEYSYFWSKDDWESTTYDWFLKFLDSEHSYIDVGSWIGPTVLYGAQLAKHVYALESDPVAYKEFQENLRLNPNFSHKVSSFQACLADESGTVKMGTSSMRGDSMSSLLFSSEEDNWEATAYSLEDLISQAGINDCNFIKIDIEGGECVALPVMYDYLKQHKPSLHLSVHTPWFEDEIKGLDVIKDVAKLYKYCFDDAGNPVDIESLPTGFYILVLTDSNE